MFGKAKRILSASSGYKVVTELKSDSDSGRQLIPRSLLRASRDVYEAAVQEPYASEDTSLALKQLHAQL